MADRSRRFRVTCSAMILSNVLATACGSDTPHPSGAVSTLTVQATIPRSPTSTEAPSRAFTSELYGFELVLPLRWKIRAAATAWVSGLLEGGCPPSWDCFSDTTDGRTLAVAAIDVPENTTLEEWQAGIHRSAPSHVVDSDTPSETNLDGERALIWTAASELEHVKVIKLAALRGTRAYMVLFVSPSTTSRESDQAVFDSVMSTFHFAAS